MGNIQLGNLSINEIYAWNNPVNEVYIGSTLVWSNSTPVEPEDSIELSDTTLSFSSNGGSQIIFVNASGSWLYENNQDWVLVNDMISKVRISVDPNTTGTSRIGTIGFICGSAEETLTIQQEG